MVEKPFGHDLDVGARRSPPSCTSTSTSRSSTGSTTTSGRWAWRRSSTCGSRTRCSSRSGAATTSSCVQITMAEDFGVDDRGHFYDPVGALRDVVVNHLMQVVVGVRDGAARRGAIRTTIKDAQVALFRAVVEADPAHYVRGQYDGYLDVDGVAAGLDDRDVLRAAARDRELALGGRAVLHPDRQAAARHADRAAARVQGAAAARLRACDRELPEPNQSSSSSTRRPASGWSSRRTAPTRRRRRRSTSTWSSRPRAARAPTPYEVLLHAALVGDSTRFTRQDGVEETWRVMQPLLDAPPPVHPYAQGSWGPEAANALVAGPRPLARPVGGVVSADDRRRPDAAERGGPVAVPADRGVRVHLGLPHRRADRPGRCDRLAVRAAVRRAQRVRKPARPPGRELPARPVRDQPSHRPALRARARTCS